MRDQASTNTELLVHVAVQRHLPSWGADSDTSAGRFLNVFIVMQRLTRLVDLRYHLGAVSRSSLTRLGAPVGLPPRQRSQHQLSWCEVGSQCGSAKSSSGRRSSGLCSTRGALKNTQFKVFECPPPRGELCCGLLSSALPLPGGILPRSTSARAGEPCPGAP